MLLIAYTLESNIVIRLQNWHIMVEISTFNFNTLNILAGFCVKFWEFRFKEIF